MVPTNLYPLQLNHNVNILLAKLITSSFDLRNILLNQANMQLDCYI